MLIRACECVWRALMPSDCLRWRPMAHPWAHRLILLVLRRWFGVHIGYKGGPALPTRETERWNRAVSSRRFYPVLGLCVRFGHRRAFCA